jgi:glycosyltransferase involved in cell wall biosynthesis
MQMGLPLLASNTEVLNEVYDNAALYFDPDDPKDIAEKMHLLATDKQFYTQVQEKSIKRGQDFSWQKMADQTLAIYEECLT